MHKWQGKLVLVSWEDANSPAQDAWEDATLVRSRLVPVQSVGWIIERNKRLVTLAASLTDGGAGACGSLITIPMANVVRIKRL